MNETEKRGHLREETVERTDVGCLGGRIGTYHAIRRGADCFHRSIGSKKLDLKEEGHHKQKKKATGEKQKHDEDLR